MKKGFLKRTSVFLTMVVACLFMSINTAQALDHQKDDSDLIQINIYQFTLTRDNMTVLSQRAGVKSIEIPASDTGNLPSTAFVVQPTKDGLTSRERFVKYFFMFMDDFLKIEQQKTVNLF